MAHLRPARSWEGWGTNNPVAPFLSTHSNITERLCVDTVRENARLKTFFLERESERHLRTTSLSAGFKSKHPKGCSREHVSTLLVVFFLPQIFSLYRQIQSPQSYSHTVSTVSTVHNVYIVQFFFLSTESGGTHCPTSRLSNYWTFICPSALGRKEQWEN